MNWRSLAGAIVLAGLIGGVSTKLLNLGTYAEQATVTSIPFTDSMFNVSSTSASKTLFSLSSTHDKLRGATAEVQLRFAGTGIGAMTCSLGSDKSGNEAIYLPALNVFQTAATVSRGGPLSGRDLASPDSSLAVVLHCTSTGASFGNGTATNLTQGNLWITTYPSTPPAGTTTYTPDGGITGIFDGGT